MITFICITAEFFDGIIFNDVHLSFLQTEINRLRQKGIEVALLNYDIKNSNRSFYVTGNYKLSALLAAEQLAISLKHSDSKNVVIGSYNSSFFGQAELCREFQDAACRFNLSVVAVCDTTEELLHNITSNIQGIYVTHANSLPVCRYLSESDYSPTLILSDLYPEMFQYFENGTVTAAVFQNPVKQAQKTVMQLFHILSGISASENMMVEPHLILRSNYQLYQL